ncbi:MAG: DUF58 domain-containing protein [Chloroflexi bacterium]|nr:DUF58 domain-containing protein [Chloroflexota bacterium]
MEFHVKNTAKTRLIIERPIVVPLAVALVLFAVFGGVSILYVVSYAICGAIVLSLLWTYALARGLWLTRQPSVGHLHVGSQLEEIFTAQSSSLVPATYLQIDDHSNFPGYPASRVESLGIRQTKSWHVYWRCRRRGRYHLGPLTVRLGDPFGFFSLRQEYDDTITFLVLPPVVDLPGLELPRGSLAGSSSGAVRVLQVTSTASTVRSYQPGDSVKRIHWPTTARRNELFVKDYDLERSSDLWIVLDLDALTLFGEEDDSTEEYGVRIAVGLANRVLREGRAVGLLTTGRDRVMVAPERSGDQFDRLLGELAGVRCDGEQRLSEVLPTVESLLGREDTIAVITSSGHIDWVRSVVALSQRGLSPVVFLVDQSSFGGPVRGVTIANEVLRSNIPCHLIQRGYRFRILVAEGSDLSGPRVLARGYRTDIVPS